MARTKGARDKAPRKRRGNGAGTGKPKKYAAPITKLLEITPLESGLLPGEIEARGVYVSADSPGTYDVDVDMWMKGEWVRRRQPICVVEQDSDVFGTYYEEPFLTSQMSPVRIRRVYAEGTTAPRVFLMY